jgi:ribosomal protein L3
VAYRAGRSQAYPGTHCRCQGSIVARQLGREFTTSQRAGHLGEEIIPQQVLRYGLEA